MSKHTSRFSSKQKNIQSIPKTSKRLRPKNEYIIIEVSSPQVDEEIKLNLKEHIERLPKTQYRTRLLRVINSCKAFEWEQPLESWTVGNLRCLEKSRYIGKKTMLWLVSNTPIFQKFPVYPEWKP